MGGRHHPQPRFGGNPAHRVTMQRDAHPVWRAVRRHPVKADLIKRQAQRVRLAAIHCDHPPLNRAVVTPAKDRPCDMMGARTRNDEPGQTERNTSGHW